MSSKFLNNFLRSFPKSTQQLDETLFKMLKILLKLSWNFVANLVVDMRPRYILSDHLDFETIRGNPECLLKTFFGNFKEIERIFKRMFWKYSWETLDTIPTVVHNILEDRNFVKLTRKFRSYFSNILEKICCDFTKTRKI